MLVLGILVPPVLIHVAASNGLSPLQLGPEHAIYFMRDQEDRMDSMDGLKSAYTLQVLGTLPGYRDSRVQAINNHGDVVGYVGKRAIDRAVEDRTEAVLFRNGKILDLGSYFASSINGRGHIVGAIDVPDTLGHAALWSGGRILDLGTLPGSIASIACAINSRDHIAGYADLKEARHAFLYMNGHMNDLGTLGGTFSEARSLNDRDEVVGVAERQDGRMHAFFWKAGRMTDLNTLGGAASIAYSINRKAQIVGDAQTTNGDHHAFLRSSGKLQDLGTLGGLTSSASSINASGDIVGFSEVKNTDHRAVLWQRGRIYDLNMLLPPNAGIVLEEAYGINDRGDIVGQGRQNGDYRGFLLVRRHTGNRNIDQTDGRLGK